MPNRIIKDSINESAGLAGCSIFAQDLYKRLITYADDYGRFNADTMVMRARLYPRELDTVTETDIVEGLIELAGSKKIAFYRPHIFNQFGKTGVYGAFPNWESHQRVRGAKSKCPDPDDTDVNDWYLRRFVPLDLRVAVLERDKFKCQICGKYITSSKDAKRFVKLGTGMYHIDHIIPVLQGGRAIMENLRLTCPDCNLRRKKQFSFDEILSFSQTASRRIAADRGNSPPNPIQSNPNPIQSNPNPIQSNPNPIQSNPNPIQSESNPMEANASCSEPKNASEPKAENPALYELSLVDGTVFPVDESYLSFLQKAYPAVDVEQELRKIVAWIDANPDRRKTAKGIKRFVTNWLSKEQDRAGNAKIAKASKHINPFSGGAL